MTLIIGTGRCSKCDNLADFAEVGEDEILCRICGAKFSKKRLAAIKRAAKSGLMRPKYGKPEGSVCPACGEKLIVWHGKWKCRSCGYMRKR